MADIDKRYTPPQLRQACECAPHLDTPTVVRGSSSERGVYAASSPESLMAQVFLNAHRLRTVKRRKRRAPISVVVPGCARHKSKYENQSFRGESAAFSEIVPSSLGVAPRKKRLPFDKPCEAGGR